jgi:hypothetical protein
VQELIVSGLVRNVPPVPVMLMFPARLSYRFTGVSLWAGSEKEWRTRRAAKNILILRILFLNAE